MTDVRMWQACGKHVAGVSFKLELCLSDGSPDPS
jgi:hypothetical protein